MIEFKTPLPLYRCHKVVGALKIKAIESTGNRFSECSRIVFENEAFPPALVTNDWLKSHQVEVGGYIVQYKDNYVSYSPAKAFDEGYSAL